MDNVCLRLPDEVIEKLRTIASQEMEKYPLAITYCDLIRRAIYRQYPEVYADYITEEIETRLSKERDEDRERIIPKSQRRGGK